MTRTRSTHVRGRHRPAIIYYFSISCSTFSCASLFNPVMYKQQHAIETLYTPSLPLISSFEACLLLRLLTETEVLTIISDLESRIAMSLKSIKISEINIKDKIQDEIDFINTIYPALRAWRSRDSQTPS